MDNSKFFEYIAYFLCLHLLNFSIILFYTYLEYRFRIIRTLIDLDFLISSHKYLRVKIHIVSLFYAFIYGIRFSYHLNSNPNPHLMPLFHYKLSL